MSDFLDNETKSKSIGKREQFVVYVCPTQGIPLLGGFRNMYLVSISDDLIEFQVGNDIHLAKTFDSEEEAWGIINDCARINPAYTYAYVPYR